MRKGVLDAIQIQEADRACRADADATRVVHEECVSVATVGAIERVAVHAGEP
jgi:hypothetical protein